jgi:hypothetical protein
MIEIGKYISSDINVLLLFGITFTLFYLFIGMVLKPSLFSDTVKL